MIVNLSWRKVKEITIPGDPVAKARPRLGKFGTYTPEKTKSYGAYVAVFAQQAFPQPIREGAIRADIAAFFPIPKSMKKADRVLAERELLPHTKKPDKDNVEKAILDGMNRIAYDDDSRVAEGLVSKRYSLNPRVEVTFYVS